MWSGVGGASSEFRVGTGAVNGSYYRFTEELIETMANQKLPFRIVNVSTDGTVDNLVRLGEGSLDAAIVQSDAAYYSYEGKHGYTQQTNFAAGLPLFPEYMQVLVRSDSKIRILGDLRGKIIGMGPPRSGSFYNVTEILREIGLRPGVDFESRTDPLDRSIVDLVERRIDAVIRLCGSRH